MVFSLLFSRKRRKEFAILRAEAKRRGVTLEELDEQLTRSELRLLLGRDQPIDVTRWGLVPDAELSTEPHFDDEDLADAHAAAKNGQWRPAAEALAMTWKDWDRRSIAVSALAQLAADDDTWLKAWQAEKPDDPQAAVVHAQSLVYLAWQIRGSARANATSAEQFEGFHRVLDVAETTAWRATELAAEDPTPWDTLLICARATRADHEEFGRRWDELVKRAPLHRFGHDSALQYWCQKWCGSHERMFAFAETAAASSPVLAPLVLQAAYEKQSDDEAVWTKPTVLSALDTVLATVGDGGPFARRDASWALFSLVRIRRIADALPLFRIIGAHVDTAPWSYYPDPVKTFAELRTLTCRENPDVEAGAGNP